MALCSDAAMMLFYDFEGDTTDHDDWHSYEHFHERLSVPGFLRASRWIATAGAPKYMVMYEVDGVEVATSEAYLDRLNNPTEWTSEVMPRLHGMTRGFCHVSSSSGFGLGNAAAVFRFRPTDGGEERLKRWLALDVLPAIASRRGIVGAHFMQPAAAPPMTLEQELRGRDAAMSWLVMAMAYDIGALEQAVSAHFDPQQLQNQGAADDLNFSSYALHYTATMEEVARTAPFPVLTARQRRGDGSGPRR